MVAYLHATCTWTHTATDNCYHTVIVEAVRFLQVDNVKVVWYTSLHSRHPEIEPLHVSLRVQIRLKYKLVFPWATANRIQHTD